MPTPATESDNDSIIFGINMVIVRLMGGMGNQMFQYAIAKSMAQRNNDIFKLDLSFYPKQTLRKYELDLFKINENIATEKECIKLRGKEGFFFKIANKLNMPLNRPFAYIREKQISLFDEKMFSLKGDIYLDGYWQNEQYFKKIRKK